MADLVNCIALQAIECLNTAGDVGVCIKQGYRDDAGLTISSDTDAELLIHVPFNGRIARLTGIAFGSNTPAAGPRSIKLFVNSPTLGFAEAAALQPAFAFELSQEGLSLENEAAVSLPAVKFRNVHTLSIFVESNQSGDDEETTTISKIVLFGQEGDSFDVASIKDVSKEDS